LLLTCAVHRARSLACSSDHHEYFQQDHDMHDEPAEVPAYEDVDDCVGERKRRRLVAQVEAGASRCLVVEGSIYSGIVHMHRDIM
jgi:hypothetical protein